MTEEGRYSFPGLNRIFHERARLGIMTSLMSRDEGFLFPELKSLCDLTDGNLNRHLSVLEDADCIEVWKSGAGRKKQTLVRTTETGRQMFLDYLAALETVVRDATNAANEVSNASQLGFASGT